MNRLKLLIASLVVLLLGCSDVESTPEYLSLKDEVENLNSARIDLERDIAQLDAQIVEMQDQQSSETDSAWGSIADLQIVLDSRENEVEETNRLISGWLENPDIRQQVLRDHVIPACERAAEQQWLARGVVDEDDVVEVTRANLSAVDLYWMRLADPDTTLYSRALEDLRNELAENLDECLRDGFRAGRKSCESVDRLLLKKNPDDFRGMCIIGQVEIVQYDTNTGICSFHGHLDGRSDVRVQFGRTLDPQTHSSQTDCGWFDLLKEGMTIDFWAYGIGSHQYSTSIGGTRSIPAFKLVGWS